MKMISNCNNLSTVSGGRTLGIMEMLSASHQVQELNANNSDKTVYSTLYSIAETFVTVTFGVSILDKFYEL